ncbi:YceD family protein [Paracoccus sp. (in: a-proteobacteria)]|uniref:YceD family protein n=1 Tax=Paracoccus sp. TaxID=267 RepID=UPI00396CD537
MTTPESHPQRLRVAHLNPNTPTSFHLRPNEEVRAAIAQELGLDALSRLDFQGSLRAESQDGWLLSGTLRARVTQPCVVTLKPVRSDIEDPVRIRFSPHVREPEGDEVEMPDETLEPLGNFIDLTAIMVEALSLSLPEYPRAEGAGLPAAAAPADEPSGDTRRPFAGLDKLLGDKGRES